MAILLGTRLTVFRGGARQGTAFGVAPSNAAPARQEEPAEDGRATVDLFNRVRHTCLTMKTATVRDLRNHFPRVAAWIEAGESVQITRAGKVIARLVPARPQKPPKFKMPDIQERLDRTFGDSSYDSSDLARGLELSRGDGS